MGKPKAWLQLGGQTLLARVVHTLQQVVHPIVVVAAPGQDLPPLPDDVEVIRDEIAYQGPLQGIAQGLEALPVGTRCAYMSACDVPLITPQWVRFLVERLAEADVVVPVVDGRAHPLAAVYRLNIAPTARQLLAQGLRRPPLLFEAHPTIRIEAGQLRQIDRGLDCLRNVNTPRDLADLRAYFEARP